MKIHEYQAKAVLASFGVRALVANAPSGLPRASEISIDPMVLLFTLGISVFAGLLFGASPALKFARPNLSSALKEGDTVIYSKYGGNEIKLDGEELLILDQDSVYAVRAD